MLSNQFCCLRNSLEMLLICNTFLLCWVGLPYSRQEIHWNEKGLLEQVGRQIRDTQISQTICKLNLH